MLSMLCVRSLYAGVWPGSLQTSHHSYKAVSKCILVHQDSFRAGQRAWGSLGDVTNDLGWMLPLSVLSAIHSDLGDQKRHDTWAASSCPHNPHRAKACQTHVLLQDSFRAGQQAWVPSGDASNDPGWMLPLSVLSAVYSTYLSTAGEDEGSFLKRPLELRELQDPRGGLLDLLKFALWQVCCLGCLLSSGSTQVLMIVLYHIPWPGKGNQPWVWWDTCIGRSGSLSQHRAASRLWTSGRVCASQGLQPQPGAFAREGAGHLRLTVPKIEGRKV